MSNYLSPKTANISFNSLLKEALLVSSHSRARAGTSLLSQNPTKADTNDPAVRPISFGRPSRRTIGTAGSSGSSGILSGVTSSLLGGSLFGSIASLFGSAGQPAQQLSLFKLADSTFATLSLGTKVGNGTTSGSATSHFPVSHSLSTGNPAFHATNQTAPSARGFATVGRVSASSTGSTQTVGHQVHIHVSALDTQSFLDRSSHIAQAVKSAILQSSSLNDVIAEL